MTNRIIRMEEGFGFIGSDDDLLFIAKDMPGLVGKIKGARAKEQLLGDINLGLPFELTRDPGDLSGDEIAKFRDLYLAKGSYQ